MCDYVVWEHHDPRKVGDNYSEVNKTVSFVGSFDKAIEHYNQMKGMMKFAGATCNYFGFPVKLRATEQVTVGDKVILYPAKTEPDDDDFNEPLEEDFW
jgi:hypothetical protein